MGGREDKEDKFYGKGIEIKHQVRIPSVALGTSMMSVADHVESCCVRIGYCKTGGDSNLLW